MNGRLPRETVTVSLTVLLGPRKGGGGEGIHHGGTEESGRGRGSRRGSTAPRGRRLARLFLVSLSCLLPSQPSLLLPSCYEDSAFRRAVWPPVGSLRTGRGSGGGRGCGQKPRDRGSSVSGRADA